RWTAADVERLPGQRIDLLRSGRQRVDQILDEEDVPHLTPVAVERDGLTRERPKDEVRDPALILRPELMRPVDAAHAEDGASKPEHPRVVENVLVGGALRAAVRSMDRERLILGDAARRDATLDGHPARRGSLELEPRDIAVDLVRRQEENSRLVRR